VDCRIPLREGTPEFCPKCEEHVEDTDTFCGNCGYLLPDYPSDSTPECENHPDRDAVAGCVICGKPVCEECARENEGRVFCENDDHLKVYEGFVVAYTTSTDYEAEMIRANLEGAGIRAHIFNQHDHVYFVNMGALALVNVMVPRHQLEDALEVIGAIVDSDVDFGDEEDGEDE
jgi:hypothetical protein